MTLEPLLREQAVVERLELEHLVPDRLEQPADLGDRVLAVVAFERQLRRVLELERTEDALAARELLAVVEIREVRRVQDQDAPGRSDAFTNSSSGRGVWGRCSRTPSSSTAS